MHKKSPYTYIDHVNIIQDVGTFIAENTLPQSNPYSPNQVRRKK